MHYTFLNKLKLFQNTIEPIENNLKKYQSQQVLKEANHFNGATKAKYLKKKELIEKTDCTSSNISALRIRNQFTPETSFSGRIIIGKSRR